jgi:DNA-directed RNA polymerase specialized sigma24 family protein
LRRRRWLAAIRRIEPKPWRDPVDPDLWAALQDLDPQTRSALLLNVVDGYTQIEIAEMLSVPVGTVSAGSRAAGRDCAKPSRQAPGHDAARMTPHPRRATRRLAYRVAP